MATNVKISDEQQHHEQEARQQKEVENRFHRMIFSQEAADKCRQLLDRVHCSLLIFRNFGRIQWVVCVVWFENELCFL
ncbi:hypothetical protein J3R74_001221 [Puniceicoccus vermicola]